jgi:hypothetical protein
MVRFLIADPRQAMGTDAHPVGARPPIWPLPNPERRASIAKPDRVSRGASATRVKPAICQLEAGAMPRTWFRSLVRAARPRVSTRLFPSLARIDDAFGRDGSTGPISTAEASLRAHGEPEAHRSRSQSVVRGPPSGRLRAGRFHRVGHRSAEADVQAIPAIDCDDRKRQRDDLLRREAARELVEELIRCARVGLLTGDHRYLAGGGRAG